jgi:hypothetical protein
MLLDNIEWLMDEHMSNAMQNDLHKTFQKSTI